MTWNPDRDSASTWCRHSRPESGKPCRSTTGRPSPVTSKWTSTPELSMCMDRILLSMCRDRIPPADVQGPDPPVDVPSAVVAGGEVEPAGRGGRRGGALGPAGGDRLEPCVEADPLHAVDV